MHADVPHDFRISPSTRSKPDRISFLRSTGMRENILTKTFA